MIQQIAVFLENEEGKASACCKILKEAGVNLCALSIADTREFGILRIIADDNERALAALKKAGLLASQVELVGLEVPHETGALSNLLITLGDNGVNVEYMYSYAEVDGCVKIAFKTNEPERAVALLKKAGANVL